MSSETWYDFFKRELNYYDPEWAKVAVTVLEGVYNHISYLCASKDYYLLADVETKIESGLEKIQAITEGE